MNPAVRERRKSVTKADEQSDDTPEDEGVSSGADNHNAGKKPRPLGNKAAKRRVEEELIMENVSKKLKEGVSSAGSGVAVAAAINDFSAVLSSFFHDWQEKAMLQTVDPEL